MSTAPVAARPHLLPWFIASVVGVGALAYFSIVTGVVDLDLSNPGQVWELLRVSRGHRTAALILAGSPLAIAGMIMQMLTRNRFVEPSTAGTTDFATLGLLLLTLFAPATPQIGKMVAGAVTALLGTALFLLLLKSLRVRGVLVVPLMGLMLGGIVASIVTFIAYQEQLSQSLSAWTSADLSGVIEGRYELLWLMVLVLIGTVMTEGYGDAGVDASVQEKLLHPDNLIGRTGQPEDLANAMLWLCSPASAWVSGQVIQVHGGGNVVRLFGK